MCAHVIYVLAVTLVFLGSQCSSELTVRSLLLRSHIRYRFATTVVTSTVVNDDLSTSWEALFEVLLPEEAFISNFTMNVDGEVYPGRVEEKKSAMKAYQTAKKQGQSAGYIKTTARYSNKFDVSVNVKPGSMVTFSLTYQQLLVRRHGMYEHKMHVNPGRVVRDLKVEIFLEEIRPITKLETSMKKDLGINAVGGEGVKVTEPSTLSRYIVYNPTRDQQKQAGTEGVSGEILVKYDVERTKPAGEVLIVDGYFLHFFAPENSGTYTSVPKDILFVLDISGSMTGTKIHQLKTAMKTILQELNVNDTFNIFSFNDMVWKWKQTLVPVTPDIIREALEYVTTLEADDATDINKALTVGVEFLLNNRDKSHVPLVFFLTDGQPTSGVKDPATVANNVEQNNEGVSSVFGLAFGEAADYNLMKIVSVQNGGFARKIYEAADASEQVKGFYDEIQSTVMQNLTVSYLNGTVEEDTLTPTTFGHVFKGNDVVIAGRVAVGSGDINSITGIVTAETSRGKINIVLDNDTDDFMLPSDPQRSPSFVMPVDFASVTEKTWAYLTIKELLKQKKKATYKEKEKVDDLDKRILEMSLKYKFVTPLTSMVATKPEDKTSQATVHGDEYEMKMQTSQQAVPAPGRKKVPLKSNSNAHISRGMSSYPAGPVMMNVKRPSHNIYKEPVYTRNSFISDFQIDPQTNNDRRKVWKRVHRGRKRNFIKGRRGKKNSRKCRIVKTVLEGYGTTLYKQTKCVKIKRVQSGTFLLHPRRPTNTDLSVEAIFAGGKRKPNLSGIKIILKKDNLTYNISLVHDINTTTWRSPDSSLGHVSVSKHVMCRGRRGKAKVFVNINLSGQQAGHDGRTRRDVKKRVRISSQKAKKMSSAFQGCQGRIAKESLSHRSERFVARGSSVVTDDVTSINI